MNFLLNLSLNSRNFCRLFNFLTTHPTQRVASLAKQNTLRKTKGLF
ncbi:hypothetical protein [Campylobacter troglodytis]|nr:hypothetical protein [Campylobacter troglodytis]